MVAQDSRSRLRFIFIAPNPEYEFYLPVKRGMADAAAALGVDAVFSGTRGVDPRAQARLLRDAVAEGYDGIAVSLIDAEAFDDEVQHAVDRGVPVVAFNVDDDRTPNARLAAVCQNLYEAGRVLGRSAASFVEPESRVLATMHDSGVSALEDRLRGAQEALGPSNVTWKVIVTGTELDAAMRMIGEALASDEQIRTVLATGMIDTEAAGLTAEKDFEGRDCAVAGFDLSPTILRLVKKGTIRFTIDQQPYVQGFYPVVQLTLLRRYGIKPSNIDAGAAIITAENADTVMSLTRDHYR